MKRFLLSFFVLPLLCVFNEAAAQSCNIGSVVISNNRVIDANGNDGICRATFDASFTINNASGNNDYIFIQTFIQTAIKNGVEQPNPNPNPNYFGCSNGTPSQTTPPDTQAEIGNPLLNIVIDNSGATPTFATTYLVAPGVIGIRGVVTASQIEREDLGNGNFRFTLKGLQIDMPYECTTGTEYTYTSNVFTTTAENLSVVNCVNCGVTTSVPSLDVSGTLNCDDATINFNNFSNTAMTVNYSLYSDVDGDGFLTPSTNGGQDLLISSSSITVSANTTETVNTTIPNTYRGKDVLVAVNLGAGQLVHKLTTLACPTQSCNIGNIMIQNPRVTDNSGSDGICRATFDATFTIANNSNNRYIFIQTYVASATQNGVPVPQDQLPNTSPNHFGCTGGEATQTAPPRTPAEVGSPLLNIVIDNSGTTPVLSTTYLLSSGIPVRGVLPTSQIQKQVLSNGEIRFIITGLQLDMPYECTTNTEYTFATNIFTTATTNATAVNCVNCSVATPLPTLQVSGTTNCNVVTTNFNNGSSQSLTLNYSLYSDVNEDGILLPTTEGGQDLLITTGTVTVASGQTSSQTFTLPNSFRGKDVFVAVNIGNGQLVQLLPTIECALPVTFKSFNAKRMNTNVNLSWETAMESNNKGFSVQRNTGRGWIDVAFIESKAPGGNSSSLLAYEFNEANTEKNVTQYRLLQVDIDGKSKLSEVRSVRGLSQASKNTIFPNPSNDGSVSIIFDDERGNRDVLISDMGGRVIKQYRNVGASTMKVDQLNPGMYSIRIVNQATGSQTIEKIVVNK